MAFECSVPVRSGGFVEPKKYSLPLSHVISSIAHQQDAAKGRKTTVHWNEVVYSK